MTTEYDVDDLLNLGLCRPYDRKRLGAILSRRDRGRTSAAKIAANRAVPTADRLSVLIKLIPTGKRDDFARECGKTVGIAGPTRLSVEDLSAFVGGVCLELARQTEGKKPRQPLHPSALEVAREKLVSLALTFVD